MGWSRKKKGAHLAQCARSAIWASGRTRDPYFEILGASLVFESRFGCFLHTGNVSFLDFYPISPISTFFHTFFFCSFPPHPLFSRLSSPHHGDPEKAGVM